MGYAPPGPPGSVPSHQVNVRKEITIFIITSLLVLGAAITFGVMMSPEPMTKEQWEENRVVTIRGHDYYKSFETGEIRHLESCPCLKEK